MLLNVLLAVSVYHGLAQSTQPASSPSESGSNQLSSHPTSKYHIIQDDDYAFNPSTVHREIEKSNYLLDDISETTVIMLICFSVCIVSLPVALCLRKWLYQEDDDDMRNGMIHFNYESSSMEIESSHSSAHSDGKLLGPQSKENEL